MNVSQAVLQFREKLKLSQPAFAEAAGISFRTICRYEAGTQEPSLKPLAKLAALARSKQLDYLGSFFEGLRQTKIATRMTTRPSDDTCRITRLDLSRWAKAQLDCFWLMDSVLGRLPPSPERELLRECAGMVGDCGSQMAPYLTTADYGALFSAEMKKRVRPDGSLDLTGISLGANVQPISGGIRVQSNALDAAEMAAAYKAMRDKLQGVKPSAKKKGK